MKFKANNQNLRWDREEKKNLSRVLKTIIRLKVNKKNNHKAKV